MKKGRVAVVMVSPGRYAELGPLTQQKSMAPLTPVA